jgi:pyridoxamine 5'-phosphate oxidase
MDKIYLEAIERFEKIYEKVRRLKLNEPTAMSLATSDAKGNPSVRIVLLKGVDERGFVFFTNHHSRKGQELAHNPHAALCFFWDEMNDHQIRVEGKVESVSDEESDAYWITRPRTSQLGAWASHQSESMPSRLRLIMNVTEFKRRYAFKPVPRPPFWGGLRLIPQRIEFWHRRIFRLHDRVLYQRSKDKWTKELLYP